MMRTSPACVALLCLIAAPLSAAEPAPPPAAAPSGLSLLVLPLHGQAKEVLPETVEAWSDALRDAARPLLGKAVTVLNAQASAGALKKTGKSAAACTGACEMKAAQAVNATWIATGAVGKAGKKLKVSLLVRRVKDGMKLGVAEAVGANTTEIVDSLPDLAEKAFVAALQVEGIVAGGGPVGPVEVTARDQDGVAIDGADVRIDGRKVGKTPWKGQVAFGPHEVEVRVDGQKWPAISTEVAEGKTARVECVPPKGATGGGDGLTDAQRKASELASKGMATQDRKLRVMFLKKAVELDPKNANYKAMLTRAEEDL